MLPLEKLHQTVQELRGPNGCPWDKKQTFKSLLKYLKEETQELVEAIENDDTANTCEEIGDVLYILLMFSEIAAENNLFSFSDAVEGVTQKLIFRHPHVFGDVVVSNEDEMRQVWENAKLLEKKN